ncbi:hypothetical protein THICB1_130052 [Thiomonas arsenitoxydans]|uniref:Uncharacterized protein n=1 Tax=Thiomonas arsenitoxydans (strain DSM 22701 / CIP 110005 / 3As) TaxID=426114 RepID=A0ABP1Z0Q4_THIA3|nr:hypothetical protein ACO7_110017 [Thiomonas arsenitoxydans]CQR28702.1 hypothetical protein ACO3_120017 [Thiomonas arsenitoxydans]CQR28947.1 hypothetical protein THICB6_140051 [Thiomonas arsenitoxydans]CQR29999.1 hypothetical protein THICB1_130052 [Thiomonas arsenitoxydans]
MRLSAWETSFHYRRATALRDWIDCNVIMVWHAARLVGKTAQTIRHDLDRSSLLGPGIEQR